MRKSGYLELHRCISSLRKLVIYTMMMFMQTKLLSAVDAAKELGYDRTHVTRLAQQGKIKGQKIGEGRTSAWVFTPKAIEAAKKRIEKKAAA